MRNFGYSRSSFKYTVVLQYTVPLSFPYSSIFSFFSNLSLQSSPLVNCKRSKASLPLNHFTPHSYLPHYFHTGFPIPTTWRSCCIRLHLFKPSFVRLYSSPLCLCRAKMTQHINLQVSQQQIMWGKKNNLNIRHEKWQEMAKATERRIKKALKLQSNHWTSVK